MPKRAAPEDYSVEELRRLLVEKRRSSREGRLEHFRRTGRVVTLASDEDTTSLDSLHSTPVVENEEQPLAKNKRSRLRRFLDGGLLLIEVGAVISLMFILFNG